MLKEVAEELGGQQVARGRRVSKRAPAVKRTPEGPGGRQAGRRAQGDQKDAELRVARKTSSSLDWADLSGPSNLARWRTNCRARSDSADADADPYWSVPRLIPYGRFVCADHLLPAALLFRLGPKRRIAAAA